MSMPMLAPSQEGGLAGGTWVPSALIEEAERRLG
jgi:hypothetical protein